MSDYPAGLDNLVDAQNANGVAPTAAWLLPSAVDAVQVELGAHPAGSAPNVAARIAAVESAVSGALVAPVIPTAITGVRETDDVAIMTALLRALTAQGIIADQTSVAATSTAGVLTLSGTATAAAGE